MKLRLLTAGETHEISPVAGTRLTDMARRVGLTMNTRCGEKGTCRGCMVFLESGSYRIAGEEFTVSPPEKIEARACQCELISEAGDVFVPSSSIIETSAVIEDEFLLPELSGNPAIYILNLSVPRATIKAAYSDRKRLFSVIRDYGIRDSCSIPLSLLRYLPGFLDEGKDELGLILQPREERLEITHLQSGAIDDPVLGVAVDIGTTTVAACLIDLRNGRILRRASRYNAQIERADDVASRIGCCETVEDLAEMQDYVIERTLNPLIDELCAAEKTSSVHIHRIVVSGNTVMTHLFLALDPSGMGRVPFRPVDTRFPEVPARELRIMAHENALVQMVNCISGYVGGDITSDMFVASIPSAGRMTLLVDIGTNGEIVLSDNRETFACATAAGPAFEGQGIKCGCRAATGAIQSVKISKDLELELGVIGDAKPIGICGTGIIDFIAQGFLCGLINEMGRFDVERLKEKELYTETTVDGDPVHACVLVPARKTAIGRDIFVSEVDVAELLKAKAAIYGGMQTLVQMADLTFGDLDQFVLAGGFGRHISLESAIVLGLLPDIPRDRFLVIGNGSLAGACAALLDRSANRSFNTLSLLPRVVELNLEPEFENNFIDAMVIPNMELDDFPSVAGQIEG